MDDADRNLDMHLAGRLKALRLQRGLTLDGLAEQAGVSRSMISLIERGESSPTASVLNRLATGLGTPLAALFAEAPREEASPLARSADQALWRDPETGYRRRTLSPPGFPSPLELAEIVLPPGARVAYDAVPRAIGIHQQVWLLEGRIELAVGQAVHDLREGDCLAMRVAGPTVFRNPGDVPARYLVALTTETRRVPNRQEPR